METSNNIDNNKSFLRDCFFDSKEEREHYAEMLNDPLKNQKDMMKVTDEFCEGNTTDYYNIARTFIEKVENGEVSDNKMPIFEDLISYCLGKIEDTQPNQTQNLTGAISMEERVRYENVLNAEQDALLNDNGYDDILAQ